MSLNFIRASGWSAGVLNSTFESIQTGICKCHSVNIACVWSKLNRCYFQSTEKKGAGLSEQIKTPRRNQIKNKQ